MRGEGANRADRRWRKAYAWLLRLYPRSFRERFAAGMEQTFQDLCRERRAAGRSPLGLVPWVVLETSLGILKERCVAMSNLAKTVVRVALLALGALLVPLLASQVVEGWSWKPGTFAFLYVLLFGLGMAYALVARRVGAWSYKVGVALALAAGFALGWSTMVQVAGSERPRNLLYLGVLLVGLVGVALARLEARGLARTLFAMAATLALIALLLPSGVAPELARRMAISHGVLAALFAAAGLLFRRASLARVE